MTHWLRRLQMGGLTAAIGVVALGGTAFADHYIVYHSYSAKPPPPLPGTVRFYPAYQYGPPNCRYEGTLAGPAHAPQFGIDYRCYVPVERAPRRRAVVRVKG